MSINSTDARQVEFDTPANRIIQQLQPKNQFRIDTSLPDIPFLRQLSIQGRLRTFSGANVTADSSGINIFQFIPASGETIFIYSLQVAMSSVNLVNIVVNWGIDRRILLTTSSTASPLSVPYFDSFVGDGTKVLEVTWLSSVVGNKSASMLGWTENTSRVRDVGN